jgi:hypothetical protein
MGKATVQITCSGCGAVVTKRKDNIDAARKNGSALSCSIQCAKRLTRKTPTVDLITARSTRSSNGCLEWGGQLDGDGYGRTAWRDKHGGRSVLVHRVMFELINGEIPYGMCVCHSCDNRKCIEPSHLWLGTVAENNADMMSKGRFVSRRSVAATVTGRNGEPKAP